MVGTPGLFTDEHVAQWRKITDRVHAKGAKIVVQLWALGRTQDGKSGVRVVSASDVALDGKPKPEALTVEEVQSYVQDYANSAKLAIEAGFDGIEVHGARKCPQTGHAGSQLKTSRWLPGQPILLVQQQQAIRPVWRLSGESRQICARGPRGDV